MCGIIGILSNEMISSRLLEALHLMEYRGYDSAGIAVINEGRFLSNKSVGRVASLQAAQIASPIDGNVGLGHTRWATHGVPSIPNTHPIIVETIAVVHNGIVENHREVRSNLEKFNALFISETDTECIAHLILHYMRHGDPLDIAVQKSVNVLHGMFAFCVLSLSEPQKLIGVCKGLPLLLGYGPYSYYLTSDILSVAGRIDMIFEMRDNHIATIEKDAYVIKDVVSGQIVKGAVMQPVGASMRDVVSKKGYEHFMLKEITEQPEIIDMLLCERKSSASRIMSTIANINLSRFSSIYIIACGTSFYASHIAKYIIESETSISVEIEVSSEFRYKNPMIYNDTLYVFISQSGETADTLASLKYCKHCLSTAVTVAITNVKNSQITRIVDHVLYTQCGPEISVASTKGLIGQIVMLLFLCEGVGQGMLRNQSTPSGIDNLDSSTNITSMMSRTSCNDATQNLRITHIIDDLSSIASVFTLNNMLSHLITQIATVSSMLADAKYILYVGKNICYPIAKEGALKMKELAYIPSEGIAAGELKHGPIALVDRDTPVIVLAPQQNAIFEKVASSVQEINARNGQIILFSSCDGIMQLKHLCKHTVEIPAVNDNSAAIALMYTIPMQLLAYYTAVKRGCDVDKPRNLAKSVTVE